MTTLQPGQIVQHPEHGFGIVAFAKFGLRIIGTRHGDECIFGFTGWEHAEVLKPGHVQVRVDDLELGPLTSRTEEEFVADVGRNFPEYSEGDRRLIYRALAAQNRDEQPAVSDVERHEDSDQPVSATVSLPCPQCGEDITAGVCVERCGDGWSIVYPVSAPQPGEPDHTCPPAQPDEPAERGTRATLRCQPGEVYRLLRALDDSGAEELHDSDGAAWIDQDGDWWSWEDVIEAGAVTLGWDD